MEFGLLGEHLGHSFSKQIHESISGVSYELKEVAREELDAFMRAKEFHGINVTIPYKEAVIPYLAELSPLAQKVGAVNTIVNDNGRLIGHNTDVLGFLAQLKHMNLPVEGKTVAILGDGGASKAVKVALEEAKAKSVFVVSRKNAPNTISYEDLYLHDEIQVIVNATSVGMFPHNEDALIDLTRFPALEGYVDLIYNPWRTKMVLQAQEKGIKAEGGLYMLVAQAVKASELFLGKAYNPEVIEKEYCRILSKTRNIVLIGMPTSGKSTVGRALAKELDLPFLDLDEEIVKKIQMPIADYFAAHGESAFRDVESQVINEIYSCFPFVIATGGGVILRQENVDHLKQNGRLYFLDRDLENLTLSDDRPLSKNQKNLQNLYETRYPIYLRHADVVIPNNGTKEDAVKQIIQGEQR